jgi:predicted peroxiredoxin
VVYHMTNLLALLIADTTEEKFWSALSFACASAALGKNVSLFLSGAAAIFARDSYPWTQDADIIACGAPSIAELLVNLTALEIPLFVCQTGMAMRNVTAGELRPTATPYGLIGWLRDNAQAQIIIF